MAYPKTRETSTPQTAVNPFSLWRRAFKTNSTGTGVITLGVPTSVSPINADGESGFHKLEAGSEIMVLPYGTDADGEEFRLIVELWHPQFDKDENINVASDEVWFSTPAAILDCTLDSAIVVASSIGPFVVGDMFCNLIALAANTTQSLVTRVTDDYITDGGDVPLVLAQSVTIKTLGAKWIKFHISITGGAGTAAATGNALFMVL